MFEEMSRELEELKLGMSRYEKIEAMLESLQNQLKELEEKQESLQKEYDKEEADVEQLNKRSLTAVFYTILGSKEEQIEKERQEALAARLKLEDNTRQIDDMKYRITGLREEKKQYEGCEAKYRQLYKNKYDRMKESGNAEFEKIFKIEDDIVIYKSNIKEIREAISAGNRVMNQISSAEASLNSAKGWGTWDMLGGGLLTDMMKHSHIDDARDSVSRIQSLLNNFRTELADVKINSEIHINIEGFAKFADFFFDGLISDWVVQSRIHDSMDSVGRVKQEVGRVLRKLEQMENGMEKMIEERNRELTDYIEKTNA